MKIGLYFGSFNPIHIGHLIIANYITQNTEYKKIWFVVSPQNPLKTSNTLLNEYQRLHLVNIATEENPFLVPSDVEFRLPRPSYTIDTLTYLTEKFPQHEFSVVIGSDSFLNINRWKNAPTLLENYPLLVYKRPGFDVPLLPGKNATILDAPLLDISATMIRKMVKSNLSIRYLVPEQVRLEIENNNYYRK